MARITSIRNESGLSITELLVSTIIMGFCFAVLGELVVLNTLAATKLANKTDGLTQSRFAIDRIKSDVRLGKTFVQPDNSKSHTILTIKQPVFYKDESNPGNPLNGFPVKVGNQELINIVTYEVVQDPDNPAEFLIQVSRTVDPPSEWPPSDQNYNVRSPINPPTTILKGITGPKDIADPTKLKVFQYIESKWEKPSTQGYYSASLSAVDPPIISPMITGTTLDLEIKRGGSDKKYATTFGVHAEAFLKYNRHAQVTNQ